MDAQIEIRPFDADERPQQREGNLYRCPRCSLHGLEMAGLLGMLPHGGGSFLVWLPPSYYTKGEEAAALYCVRKSTVFGTSPVLDVLESDLVGRQKHKRVLV